MTTISRTLRTIAPGIAVFLLLFIIGFILAPVVPASACTTILVGHEATAKFEADLAVKQAAMEDQYLALWRQDQDGALKLIQNLTDQAVADLERMLDDLTTRFAKELDMESLTDEQFFELIMGI